MIGHHWTQACGDRPKFGRPLRPNTRTPLGGPVLGTYVLERGTKVHLPAQLQLPSSRPLPPPSPRPTPFGTIFMRWEEQCALANDLAAQPPGSDYGRIGRHTPKNGDSLYASELHGRRWTARSPRSAERPSLSRQVKSARAELEALQVRTRACGWPQSFATQHTWGAGAEASSRHNQAAEGAARNARSAGECRCATLWS